MELTKCICFPHSANITKNDLPDHLYPLLNSYRFPYLPFFSVISQLRETSINNYIPMSVWK
ncbi:hypothetical protein [uncultured Parabacteroides sp.]|uniref:hypothetical protein n=1 Tax=uncultured Parabacteroides sp. TaxID=512312 RepID=UPI0025DEAE31|nr:hypothetical protein [uncultured Parabacteroides sp.]